MDVEPLSHQEILNFSKSFQSINQEEDLKVDNETQIISNDDMGLIFQRSIKQS